MFDSRITQLVFSCVMLLLASCASDQKTSDANYKTVPGEKHTEAAKNHYEVALDLIDLGEFEQAEAQLKKALEVDVTFGPAHNNLGKIYFDKKDLYLAAWEFRYAAKLMPDRPEPKNNLGLVLEKVGNLDEAIEQYGEGLKVAPENTALMGNMARARLRRGDKTADVRELLRQIVMKDDRPDWVRWAKTRLGEDGGLISE